MGQRGDDPAGAAGKTLDLDADMVRQVHRDGVCV